MRTGLDFRPFLTTHNHTRETSRSSSQAYITICPASAHSARDTPREGAKERRTAAALAVGIQRLRLELLDGLSSVLCCLCVIAAERFLLHVYQDSRSCWFPRPNCLFRGTTTVLPQQMQPQRRGIRSSIPCIPRNAATSGEAKKKSKAAPLMSCAYTVASRVATGP